MEHLSLPSTLQEVWQGRTFTVYDFGETLETWRILENYQVKSDRDIVKRKGNFSLVIKAWDASHKLHVAIKKLTHPFETPEHAKRVYREVRILKHMDHENVLGLLNVFSPCNTASSLKELYIVTVWMEADLHNVINNYAGEKAIKVQCGKMQDQDPVMPEDTIQFLVYQLLRALKYLHSAGIIHRDIKPANIAVNRDCSLKLLDLGLARHEQDTMTAKVTSLYWRAPEVLYNWRHYNYKVDLWSVGCVMAQMYLGCVLFTATEDLTQLLEIFKVMGSPDVELCKKMTCDQARKRIEKWPVYEKSDFKSRFPKWSGEARDLLDSLLVLDFDKRLSAEQALSHEFLSSLSEPQDEPNIERYELHHENATDFQLEQWKDHVFEEIRRFVPPSIPAEISQSPETE